MALFPEMVLRALSFILFIYKLYYA